MRVVLGVTGCIGAYKSALILRMLQQEGIDVIPVLTSSARHFIGPLTLEKLSGHKVVSELFENDSTKIEHISIARESDLLLVAPATANILAKFAAGIADDFLSTLYLSTTTPVIVAPAMNVEMWRHRATQKNLERLRERGVLFVDPESGYQACGEYGEGRLAEPASIVSKVTEVLGKSLTLKGRRVLVTAGPTIEDIDPVRYISNRSSGKMGYALAAEASKRGAEVILVSGPTCLEIPNGITLKRVRSASEMLEAVLCDFDSVDVVVKAAAVADYSPARASRTKIKKGGAAMAIELEPTPDILRALAEKKQGQLVVGFAAESDNLAENARAKLLAKNLDLIVANDITKRSSGFDSDSNEVLIIGKNGQEESLPLMKKSELAERIWEKIENLLETHLE